MKRQEMWRKCQLLLIIACGTYPLVMAILDRFASGMLKWGWLFLAAYVILSLAGLSVKGKMRLSAGIFMAVGMAALAFLLAPGESRLGAVAAAALCGLLLIWSMKMGGWSSREEIPVLWIASGAAAHLIGQMLLHTDRVAGGNGLAVYSGGFLAALFGFSLLTMLSMTRSSLVAASGKRQSVPGTMRRKNSMMTVALFGIAVLASLLPAAFSGVMELLRKAVLWLVQMVIRLIPDAGPQQVEDITNTTAVSPPGSGGGGDQMMLNPIVEKFMAVCGAIILFLFLGYLLYRLYKIVAEVLHELIGSLGKFASSVSEDYVDEVTDTREELTAEKIEKAPLVSRMPFLEPRNLAPAERIRFRYQRLMRRHPEWDAGSTARENLPAKLAVLYEQARYSSHPVSEEDASAFSDGSKTL